MQRTIRLTLAWLPLAVWTLSAPAADKVNLENLLPQMTNLSLLCEYPDPPYVTKQFSSYDRASEAPGSESWFANADRGFMLYDGVLKEETPYFKTAPMPGKAPDGRFTAGTRVGIAPTHKRMSGYVWAYATGADGRAGNGKIPQGYVARSAIALDPQGHVLAEMDGPGCVVRIWSANPRDAGKIRIYLDGAEKPVIEAPLESLLGGKWKITIDGKETIPFPDPLACERSRGFNLYFPIAYARHCKITIDRPNIYYHVDYRTYSKGTEVETFSLEALVNCPKWRETLGALRPATQRDLSNHPFKHKVHDIKGRLVDLKPGESRCVHLNGPKAIESLEARIDKVGEVRLDKSGSDPGSNGLHPEVWRSLVLTAKFDGAPHPQIWCPLGDFFGASPGFQPYSSLPFEVHELPLDDAARSRCAFVDDAVSEICVDRGTKPGERSCHSQLASHSERVHMDRPLDALPRQMADRNTSHATLPRLDLLRSQGERRVRRRHAQSRQSGARLVGRR